MPLTNAIWKVTHGGVVLLDFSDYTDGEPQHQRNFLNDRVPAIGAEVAVNIGRKNIWNLTTFRRVKYFENDDEARSFMRIHSDALSHLPADCTFEWLRMGVTDTLINTAIANYSAHVENNFFIADYTLQGGLWVYGTFEPPPIGGTGFAYYSPISINSGQVSGTQTDFPVLVSLTDSRFRSTAHGGHVQSATGFDIRPFSDSGLSSALSYELERYNATTGEVIMWVKVGSLSSSTTPIYLAYGSSTLTTDASSAATWSNGFTAVWHLKDGATLSLVNSVGVLFTLGNSGATASGGIIDGCANVIAASNQHMETTVNGPGGAAMTIGAWINAASLPDVFNCFISQGFSTTDIYLMMVKDNGKLSLSYTATGGTVGYNGTGSHTLAPGTWYYVAMTYDSTGGLQGYVNGASDHTASAFGAGATGTAATALGYRRGISATYNWNGKLDEVRASNVARSSAWILTEYNNQSAPGTFETLGTEVTL